MLVLAGAILRCRMRRGLSILVVGAVVLGMTAPTSVVASVSRVISVHLLGAPNVRRNVHLSFRPVSVLPAGGYYYAVVVLEPYKHYTRSAPPPCATSSDMLRTDYAYPHPGQPVGLALTPAESTTGHWCRGGDYLGGIYAVPHAPPCESRYPCRSESYKAPSPCWEFKSGQRVCGEVAQPKRYVYPEGLPRPLASGARIVAYFHVTF
jgi:hypothetical protein